ncbi:MAG: DUF262 domain-containing protein [Succinivibrionaceae bacterium]|nr:DUF262 domain-containing protein [Succinivibrionaceae bacterium]
MSEPKRTGLLELLRSSQGCQFVIPVYQRNYTWSADDQVKQYLFDLENVLKGNYKNHFLGIIIYLEKSLDFSSREFSVIDGQQRLTTTFLIIYSIKQIFVQNGDTKNVSNLEGQYLTNPYSADNIKYKLKPLVSDDDVYRCIVEDRLQDIKDGNSNVLKNYKYISNKLKEFIAAGYDANQILMAMDKLYVVCVPISEDDNAQKIFESINATGAKLTAADLIRNFLLMDLRSATQEKYYANYWKKVEEYVSADSKILEMFFRMFLALKTYTLVAKNSVYREFVSWKEQSELDIKAIFIELLEYSKCYAFLFKSDEKKLNSKLRVALTDYRKIDSDLPLSAILEFCRLKNEGKITDEILGELIGSINAYLLRRSICDINSQNISKLFPSVLKKIIDKCDGNYSNIVNILNQEMVGNTALTSGSYMPTDTQMYELLLNANVYKRPALRTILDRMELANNPAPVDLSELSVEHLMPQTPTPEWLEELDTDLESYQNNLHRIGNLTLASKPDNSKMKNALWEYKNEVLKDTGHLTMNMELLQVDRWDLQHIEDRSQKMISEICNLYPYPNVKVASVDEDDDVVDENDALEIAIKAVGEQLETVKKGACYKSHDNINGYLFTASKMYPQGNKEKYWFGLRFKRFEQLQDCENVNLILICRHKDVVVLKLTKAFLEKIKERLNTSLDEEGNIKHYHVVVFINPDNTVSMLLSKPVLEEIDISEFVVNGI